MADITISVGVSGLDSIDADVKAELNKIVLATAESLKDVQADMKESLAAHIQKDVYDAYTPKEYERRVDHAGTGIPIIASENIDPIGPFSGANADKTGFSVTAGIDYNPTGFYPGRDDWSNVDENELIGRIEKKSPPYEYEGEQRKIPKRPFWQKFVTEQTGGNALGDSFVRAMAMRGIVVGGETTVIREAQDGDY